jgi:uncharacterized membrane protein YeiB
MATTIFLAFLMLVFLAGVGLQLLGHHVGTGWRTRGMTGLGEATTAIQASLFALLGLLIAFTVSGGASRLEARQHLIVEEANAIGTAYLRVDMMPPAHQPALRELFRRYAEARIAFFSQVRHLDEARASHDRAVDLQRQIWDAAVAGQAEVHDARTATLALPAINAMIDVTTARDAAVRTHVPVSMFTLLVVLAFACAFLAGVEMSKQSRPSAFHMLAFAGTLALTCYVILNVEFPRFGLVRMGPFDNLLVIARQQMG